ncbi:MAG: protein kinase [Alphaproteobacteria bacterium]|nr:protein kinase [Alphaproteobacteria bacterium]MCB9792729.1 protein kinase [Alphaproteobacteria bacterium]
MNADAPALNLTLELSRSSDPPEPRGPLELTEYRLELAGGRAQNLRIPWPELVEHVRSVQRPHAEPLDIIRLGRRFREVLDGPVWERCELRLTEAVRRRQAIVLTIRASARELYSLPWGLLTVRGSDQPLAELQGVVIRYEWPDTLTSPPKVLPSPKLVFAWSSRGGAVPASAHRRVIQAVCDAYGIPFRPERDEVPDCDLKSLRARLAWGDVQWLHLLCHGQGAGPDQGLWFDGEDEPVSPRRVCRALAQHNDTVRTVLLCACSSGDSLQTAELGSVAQALHRTGFESVIASRFAMSARGSIDLARGVLRGLLGPDGSSVKAIVSARDQLAPFGGLDWATLQLYGRESDGPVVFSPTGSPLVSALHEAIEQRQQLLESGGDTSQVDGRILELKQDLRGDGQLKAGDVLGERYTLVERLGRGGFGTVWKARDLQGAGMSRWVAVKILHSQYAQDRSYRQRFIRGARVMAQLSHRNIVTIHEMAKEEGAYLYFVMEYLPGGDLQDAVVDGGLDSDAALRDLIRIGDALEHAHELGMVHRDVKPQNVLLDATGWPKLTDFDLVRGPNDTGNTVEGTAIGTVVYSAPEQLRDAKGVDERADVYSMGMTALFCLARRSLDIDVLQGRDALIEALQLPSQVEAVVRRATSTDREDRQATAKAFCAELREALEAKDLPPTELPAAPQAEPAPKAAAQAAPAQGAPAPAAPAPAAKPSAAPPPAAEETLDDALDDPVRRRSVSAPGLALGAAALLGLLAWGGSQLGSSPDTSPATTADDVSGSSGTSVGSKTAASSSAPDQVPISAIHDEVQKNVKELVTATRAYDAAFDEYLMCGNQFVAAKDARAGKTYPTLDENFAKLNWNPGLTFGGYWVEPLQRGPGFVVHGYIDADGDDMMAEYQYTSQDKQLRRITPSSVL